MLLDPPRCTDISQQDLRASWLGRHCQAMSLGHDPKPRPIQVVPEPGKAKNREEWPRGHSRACSSPYFSVLSSTEHTMCFSRILIQSILAQPMSVHVIPPNMAPSQQRNLSSDSQRSGYGGKRQSSQAIRLISFLAHVNRAKAFRSLASRLLFLPSIDVKHTARIASFDHDSQFHKQYQGITVDYTCCYAAWFPRRCRCCMRRCRAHTEREYVNMIM